MTNPKEALEWYKTHGDKLEPKTISEIRAEIPKAFTGWHDDTVEWIQRHSRPDYQQDSPKHASREAARMLVNWAFEAGKAEQKEQHEAVIEQCYEYTAQDHKAWWVPDKHGEEVHIGDMYKDSNGTRGKALGFVSYGDPVEMLISWGFDNCNVRNPNECEKVTPDTREKIIEDLAAQFSAIENDGIVDVDDDLRACAEQFISRVEALERD